MNNPKKDKEQVEIKEVNFDKIIKSLLTVPPKKNEKIKKKAKKEHNKKVEN